MLLLGDREARGGLVSAEALEVLGAGRERAVEVEARDRASRALPRVLRARDEDDRPVEALGEARRDDADHALVPVLAPEDVATPPPLRLGHGVHDLDRLPQDPVLDRLTIAIELLERVGVTTRLVGVLGEDELERDVRTTEPAGGVDPRSQPEADGAGVDGGRIDVRAPHERLQPRTRRRGEDPKARGCERAVLVHERDDVGDRGQRDEVEAALDCRMVGTEKSRAELVDDARPAELGERDMPTGASRRSGSRAARRPVDGGR